MSQTITLPKQTIEVLTEPISLQHAIYYSVNTNGVYTDHIRVAHGWYASAYEDTLWDGLANRLVTQYDPYNLSHRIIGADEDYLYIRVQVDIAEYLRSEPDLIDDLDLTIPKGYPI